MGCTVSVTQLVTVNALSTAAAITGTASVCAGSTTQLADVTAGVVWSSGDNTKATVDAAGLVTGIAAGAVTISYTVTNGTGCVTAVTQDITVSTSPVLSVNPATQTICSGNSASVAVTGDNGAAVTWTSNYFGLTGSGIGFTTGVLTNSGTVPYTLTLTGNALLGTCSDKISAAVTVNPAPRVMSAPQSVTVCSYETLHIALTAILSGTTINWTIVDGSNATVASGSGINNVTITNKLSSGAYTLKVTGTKDGCTSQELSVPIVVN